MWPHIVLLLLASNVLGDEQCSWGIYGENCDKTCPSNCYPDPRRNLRHCQKYTGKCSEGCVRGYHGDQCNISCSGGCLKETCNHGNGHCTLGCKQTYTGGFCNVTSKTRTALPTTEAFPVEPATDLVVIIVPIVVIIFCLVIVAVVVCMVRTRRRRREANIESRLQEEATLAVGEDLEASQQDVYYFGCGLSFGIPGAR